MGKKIVVPVNTRKQAASKKVASLLPQKKSAAVARSKANAVVKTDDRPICIVGIGASGGGLEAVEAFLRHMPADSGIAIVIVTHLDPTHASIMGDLS